MKLKEAQLLGIVALIAVAIILLCMWGGGHSSKEPATTDEQARYVGGPDAEPGAADLAEELAKDQPGSSAGRQVTAIEETKLKVGGTAPPVKAGATEENAIRTAIEEHEPPHILLTPPKDSAAPGASGAASEVQGVSRTHVVQAGETLDKISLKYYGTRHKWNEILEANKSVLSDPRKLYPGMKLTVPALKNVGVAEATPAHPALSVPTEAPTGGAPSKAAASAPTSKTTASANRTYTVQKGDTLFRIAQKVYSDGNKWKDIQAANPDKARDQRSLHAGVVLVIP